MNTFGWSPEFLFILLWVVYMGYNSREQYREQAFRLSLLSLVVAARGVSYALVGT